MAIYTIYRREPITEQQRACFPNPWCISLVIKPIRTFRCLDYDRSQLERIIENYPDDFCEGSYVVMLAIAGLGRGWCVVDRFSL